MGRGSAVEGVVRGGHSRTMRRLLAFLPFVLLPLSLLLGSCSAVGGDRGTGMTWNADGKLVDNTAVNRRESTQRHLQTSLTDALGPNWSASVTVTPLPVWMQGMVLGDGDWWWKTADVQVVLTGHGTPPVPVAELERGIVTYMTDLVKGPPSALTVAVRVAEPSVPVPVVAKPVEAVPPPATSGARSYRVQPGDTLADITTLFYGAPSDWRRIVAANPGLDPAHLTPGQELVIPSSAPPSTP